MADFNYKYYNDSGVDSGMISASSREAALQELASQDIHPFSLQAADAKNNNKEKNNHHMPYVQPRTKGKKQGVVLFTRQLASLLNSGIQLGEALKVIARTSEEGSFKELVDDLHESLTSGRGFAESLSERNDVFSPAYVSMIKAGEESGYLGATCQRLASNLEEESELKSFIVSSLIYPLVLLAVSIIAVTVMIVFVLPRFVSIYDSYDQSLPLLTDILLKFANGIQSYWFIIAAVIIFLVSGIGYYLKTEEGRANFHAFLLRTPLLSLLIVELESYRVCNSLETMLKSGVPILKALKIVENVASNVYFQQAVAGISSQVSRGLQISESMRGTIFPEMASYMVAVGEQTGELSEMLKEIADYYEKEYKNRLDRIMKLFEPFMILFLGGSIGLVVIAMLLPIMGISQMPM